MNAKELADKIRRHAFEIPLVMTRNLSYELIERIATDVESLAPKYRPPQPSDDGKYCWVESFAKDGMADCPYRLRFCSDGKHQIFSDVLGRYFDLTGNIWPCERPEVNRG